MKLRRQGDWMPVGGHSSGFTLLEVMVALVIAVVVLGGVMGGISVALQYGSRLKARKVVQPVLEAAAQQILASPDKLEQGSITLDQPPNTPHVDVLARRVVAPDGDELPNKSGHLYRILLQCGGQTLEFSVFAPKSEQE